MKKKQAVSQAKVVWEPVVYKPLKAMDALPVEIDLIMALQSINERIATSLDLDELLQGICDEVGRFLKVDRVHLALKSATGNAFGNIGYEWTSHPAIPVTKGGELPSEKFDDVMMDLVAIPPPLAVIDPVGNPKIPAGPRMLFEIMQVQSAMAGRLQYQGKVLGVLCAHQCSHVRHWNQQEATFFSVVLNQLSIAIANARMIKTLQAQHQELVSLHFRLEESHSHLEQQIAERTTQLEKANLELRSLVDDLKQLDRLKSSFLDTVSHELRTPINFITGFGSLLADGAYGNLQPEAHEAVDKILVGADRLIHLVDDLLDQTKIERGELQISPVYFDYRDLVERVANEISPLMLAKSQHLALDLPVSLPGLYSDPDRAHQILRNLLSNAIKFTPQGGTIRLNAKATATAIVTTVADTGIGIPKDAQARIFDRFYQVDNTRTRNYGGTGLGLAIVKGLLGAMGGSIEVTSRIGEGSVFHFQLPLASTLHIPQQED